METENKEQETPGINIPQSITDPAEKEYFELIEKAINIGIEKQLPFLFLSAYSDISKALIAAQGCPNCISKMITNLLVFNPELYVPIIVGVGNYMKKKDNVEYTLGNNAKKDTSRGN